MLRVSDGSLGIVQALGQGLLATGSKDGGILLPRLKVTVIDGRMRYGPAASSQPEDGMDQTLAHRAQGSLLKEFVKRRDRSGHRLEKLILRDCDCSGADMAQIAQDVGQVLIIEEETLLFR